MQNVKGETSETIKSDLKKSSEDWVNYIKNHPVKSIFFAITIFFAFKNMVETTKK